MRILRNLGIVALMGCALTFAFLYVLVSASPRRSGAPVATPAPYRVDTANGVIVVPGTAFIEAFDPATNSNIEAINVWVVVGRGSQPPACQLVDGNRLAVDDSAEAEGSTWFHVTSGDCSGWVLSEFVRATRQ